MLAENTLLITEDSLYAGFDRLTRFSIRFWRDSIVEIVDRETTLATIEDMNHRLLSDNAVIFFDHHYAFDALPAALILGRTLEYVSGALLPYALHLDMRVNQEGLPSYWYQLRSACFHWLVRNIKKANPAIQVFPVAREFELSNPRMKTIVEQQYAGANAKYIKALMQFFTSCPTGQVCILSPITGIAFPNKPVLHRQLYRSMTMVQARLKRPLPFYMVSAYPQLKTTFNYVAPLLTKHRFVAQGPFTLPMRDYDQAHAIVADYLDRLRRAAEFELPDYERIARK